MSEKEVKVPQVVIDGEKYHADVQVLFGMTEEQKEVKTSDDLVEVKRIFVLYKYIVLEKKVLKITKLREESYNERDLLYNQMEIEMRRAMKAKSK